MAWAPEACNLPHNNIELRYGMVHFREQQNTKRLVNTWQGGGTYKGPKNNTRRKAPQSKFEESDDDKPPEETLATRKNSSSITVNNPPRSSSSAVLEQVTQDAALGRLERAPSGFCGGCFGFLGLPFFKRSPVEELKRNPSFRPPPGLEEPAIPKPGIRERCSCAKMWRRGSDCCCGIQIKLQSPIQVKRKTAQNTEFTCVRMDVPEGFSRDDLKNFLDEQRVDYDFIYLPFDWGDKTRRKTEWRNNAYLKQNASASAPNKGYAFVNCTTHDHARHVMETLEGFDTWPVICEKRCHVVEAFVTDKQNQPIRRIGQEAHIEFYRNNPVMHAEVKDEYKPVIFKGPVGAKELVPFPGPTENQQLKKPRNLNKKNKAAARHQNNNA